VHITVRGYGVNERNEQLLRRNLLQVELPERGALAGLVESVEGLIYAANLDHQFHTA